MINKLIVSFFGLGYLPKVPGTWGSLGAAIIFFLIAMLGLTPSTLWTLFAILAVIVAALGIALGRWSCDFYKSKDPKPFVIDEVAGQWISFLFLPFTGVAGLFIMVTVQFFLFRISDIIKPAPARQAESLPYGWGIVTDDLMAGVYANLVGQIIFRLILA